MKSKKKKLLLIEDDKVDQMAFKRFAEKGEFPYEIEIASSVEEAKKMLKSKQFHVIVSDYFLGDGTAFDVMRDLTGTPLVVTTGTGDEEIAVKAMKMGAFDYLIKDVEGYYLKMLPVTIENAINRFEAELQIKEYQKNLEKLVEERTAKLRTEIEERKKIELELEKHHEHLQELVDERTKELAEKNKDLEEFNDLFVGREYRIKELKDKVKAFEQKYGKLD